VVNKKIYVFLSALLIVSLAGVFIYINIKRDSIKPVEIIVDNYGKVYSEDSLNSTTMSVGEFKQMVIEDISKIFRFNYINYRSEEDYQDIKKKKKTIKPDHREEIKFYFADEESYSSFLSDIKRQDWFNFAIRERGIVIANVTSPPLQNNIELFNVNEKGRLEADVSGVFYIKVIKSDLSSGEKLAIYKVEYQAKYKRVTYGEISRWINSFKNDYYFKPIIKRNPNGWAIQYFIMKSARVS
jgi:hypothetical protein